METHLADFIRDTPAGREAEAILRKCVHCGFCTATCPTYRHYGDELDGPRGRIYLIKQVLEGQPASAKTQLHLDRCLTCRSCETTCPSGVQYARLADIGREVVEHQVPRSFFARAFRALLASVLPHPARFGLALGLGRLVRPLLPPPLKRKVPPLKAPGVWPQNAHPRRVLALAGCVQPALSPATNAAAARVLDRLGIALVPVPTAGCCGAVSYHLNAQEAALDQMRRNIDAWHPLLEAGAEAIALTASGCASTVVQYGHLLAHDPAYAAKAARVSAAAKEIGELIAAEKDALKPLLAAAPAPVAFHPPCSLQHGLKMKGKMEALLDELGFKLTPITDSHLCCGSAGTYSILQPQLAQKLLAEKIAAIAAGKPAAIVTANIGCQAHLQSATDLPVSHWIEALDARLA